MWNKIHEKNFNGEIIYDDWLDEYKDIIPEMLKHLRYSQIEKLSKNGGIVFSSVCNKIDELISKYNF